ncbi:MAG TPA: restriction endonuclease fold toxin-2 domain-containing protein [Pseudonocardiaceae bacterium]|nr:restriction endonuclease fold toxin-2 domain-containing protein [Pseudonocardiaceae bacterium]
MIPVDDGDGGFQVVAGDLVTASWGMHLISEDLLAAANALASELTEQSSIAGADEAGQLFGSVYTPAAKTTLNQVGNACVITGQGAAALLETANNYLATESSVAASLLAAGRDDSSSLTTPWQSQSNPCQELHDPRGLGDSLPAAVGTTSWERQFLGNDQYRGDPGALRQVADTWRTAAAVLDNSLSDAQGSWTTAVQDYDGPACAGVDAYFTKFVGHDAAPAQPAEGQTLFANLPAACRLIATACTNYADHIEKAQAEQSSDEWFGFHPIWDDPIFGGNGVDGGLKKLVEGDPDIHALGEVAHVLDASQAVVPIPNLSGPGIPLPPLLPVPLPDPILVPVAYRPRNPSEPTVPAIAPPNPPDPRFPALTTVQRNAFDSWLKTLPEGDYSNGNSAVDPANAYQLRTSGYPEFQVPIPPGLRPGNYLMVDGMRPTDGMAVEAKYVQKPDSCYRTLTELLTNHVGAGKPTFLFLADHDEMEKYAAAINNPQNNGQIRGLEIDTNYADSVPYWRTMMAAYGINGYARYVP